MSKKPLLVTINPSHYCEKVRLALDYLKIDYTEDAHPPLFHLITTKKYKGGSVPLLITDDGNFKDSTDILHYLDKKSGNGKLYPFDEQERKKVDELEELFDTKLGTHARRWAYFYILDREDIIKQMFVVGQHPFEESMFETFFPVIKQLIKASLKISPATAERSRNKIVEIFEQVGNILSDGRKYLVGDKLSAADITFVSLALPILLPNKYAIKEDPNKVDNDLNREMQIEEEKKYWIDIIPKIMADEVKEFRKTPAGAFAMNLYNKLR